MVTPNQTQVTEEEQQKKDTTRFWELDKKTDRNEDENKEHGELKTKYANSAKNRIDRLTGDKKAATAAKEESDRLLEEERKRNKELQDKIDAGQAPAVVGNENETTDIGGKKYYTDAALLAQIKAGKITEASAIDYQANRNEEKIVVRVKGDFQKEQETKNLQTAQAKDAQAVLDAHPEFGTKHADHNSNDPLYKEWRELVADGYGLSTGGLMKALKKAEKNLGIKNTPVDRGDDFEVEDAAHPGDKGGTKTKEKEVPFSEAEEEAAVSMWTMGDRINPATNRAYTRDEAIAKAKAAKKARMR